MVDIDGIHESLSIMGVFHHTRIEPFDGGTLVEYSIHFLHLIVTICSTFLQRADELLRMAVSLDAHKVVCR